MVVAGEMGRWEVALPFDRSKAMKEEKREDRSFLFIPPSHP